MACEEVKLCVLGDVSVGKSSLVQRFVHNTFSPNCENTIGAAFMMKNLIVDGKTYKFNIWDTAGHERYRALAPMYYRSASAAIIVFDITCKNSFEAIKYWVHELNLHGESNIVLAIAGNKADLEEQREVSKHAKQLPTLKRKTVNLGNNNCVMINEAPGRKKCC